MLIENTDQVLGNHLGRSTLDLVSFHHIHQLTVFKKGYGRR
jgi:hypothetical protein